jgi:hypothetical protein
MTQSPDGTLFTPTRLGAIDVGNRIAMAPLTRNRAIEGRVPNPLAIQYYEQRASAGLIIAEATQNHVLAGQPGKPVGTVTAVDLVVARPAIDDVIALVPKDRVVASSGPNGVISRPATDHVVAVQGIHNVISVSGIDDVRALGAVQAVRTIGADNGDRKTATHARLDGRGIGSADGNNRGQNRGTYCCRNGRGSAALNPNLFHAFPPLHHDGLAAIARSV